MDTGEFSSSELEAISDLSRRYQADINLAEVADIVNSYDLLSPEFAQFMIENPAKWNALPPEYIAARLVQMHRNISSQIEAGEVKSAQEAMSDSYVHNTGAHASFGLQLIKDLGEFWRFKPTIEVIFELAEEEQEEALDYVRSFDSTDHDHSLRNNKEELVEKYKKWDPSIVTTDNINLGRELYETCFKIYERGFPNLLALRRILDGEEPDLDVLQRKRASTIRRKLTEGGPESNSVFFDLIVDAYDGDLRNGIAHNDIITDPAQSEVRIPTRGVSYGYEEFNGIVSENTANAVFLTGAFHSLVEWRAITYTDEEEFRPDWVFGERNIPERFPENLELPE